MYAYFLFGCVYCFVHVHSTYVLKAIINLLHGYLHTLYDIVYIIYNTVSQILLWLLGWLLPIIVGN